MPIEHVETLIIGGGQAGLAASHMLKRRARPCLVLERHRIAERWRSERWEGLRFQFPNWSVRLPEFPFVTDDPDGFTTSGAIVDFLTAYSGFVNPLIRCGVAVTSLRRFGETGNFVAETTDGAIVARNVVVATGPYQRPVIPDLLSDDAPVFQVHASRYTRPNQLPQGAVLVVGSGASGAQIAEELIRAGRQVYLSIGRHRRMPRRYRGRDIIWWLSTLGLDQTPVERRGPVEALALITGAYGGHTIDFREFAAQGMELLGHLQATDHSTLLFAPDVADSLAHGDAAYFGFLDMVDAHVDSLGIDLPEDRAARVARPDPASVVHPRRHLDLNESGIAAVIWATGYGFDYGWIDLPVIDADGAPVHRHGITDVPGLYFIGLPWLSKRNSSFLSGVGEDAARIADHIAARR